MQNVLNNFEKPLKKIIGIHYTDCRYLLPNTVNIFKTNKKFKYEDASYDLYGWKDNSIIDVYPTYKNINSVDELPISWKNYIAQIKQVTNIENFILLIYNRRYKKYTNVLKIQKKNDCVIELTPIYRITSDWVKATGLKNYIMDDTIVDVINKNKTESNSESNINITNDSEENELLSERLTMGIEFERDIIDQIINKYYMNFVKICESYEAKDIDKYKYTLSEIKKGTPIIHQAVLHDPTSKIYGCVDLLVRSDWLNKIFNNYTYESNNENIHYVVVDIKFHRLQYNTDGITIRNEGMIRVFKSQLYIYNKALGYMQNYVAKNAFMLGRGWIKTNTENGKMIVEKNSDPFNKPGIIDFENNDVEIVKKSEDGLKWLNELNNNSFDETRPKYNHSYPNMNNPIQIGGKKRKQSIAEESNELTLLGYVGVKHRKIAIENGIDNYKDPNLDSGKLGITGKTEKIVSALINNQKEMDEPIKGVYECPSIKDIEVFLDYEYMYSFNLDENIPYLCGIGYVNNNDPEKKWNFEYVLLYDISLEERKKMCENIIAVLEKIKATHIYTWSEVDKRLLTNESKKFNLDAKISELKWIDMYRFCLNNHINFKGAMGYGLKEVGRVLYDNYLTNVKWEKNLSSSSTVGATKHYYKNIKWNPKKVIEYNETDCRMIYEILINLRFFEQK